MTDFSGTNGDDDLDGTAGDDEFQMGQGGDDIVRGLNGTDNFFYDGTFDAHDRVFGGKGNDALLLSGAYDLTFSAHCIDSIEQIVLNTGFDYRLELNDANVAAGKTMIVNASLLDASDQLVLAGFAETDGAFIVFGGEGADAIACGAGDDLVSAGGGGDFIYGGQGNDTLNGGLGADLFIFEGGGAFDNRDRVDGGPADGSLRNELFLSGGGYGGGLTIKHDTLTNIHTIVVLGENDYTLDIRHINFAPGFTFSVDGSSLGGAGRIEVNGAGVSAVGFNFIGGSNADTFIGGRNYDSFRGLGGADTMTAGPGNSVFFLDAVSDSTGKKYDNVIGFDAQDDFFWPEFTATPGEVGGVDPRLNHGSLSTASFNDDLASAIGAGRLHVDHAVLFQPDAGSLAGELFLIIDGNGIAGYQANADAVVHFDNAKHMGEFDIDNFGTAG